MPTFLRSVAYSTQTMTKEWCEYIQAVPKQQPAGGRRGDSLEDPEGEDVVHEGVKVPRLECDARTTHSLSHL